MLLLWLLLWLVMILMVRRQRHIDMHHDCVNAPLPLSHTLFCLRKKKKVLQGNVSDWRGKL
jgi:hypothetical protein